MFDTARFTQAPFAARTARVPLPALAVFFDEGEIPAFEVRGLEGSELARCNEAVRVNRDVGELVAGLMSDASADKVMAVRDALGVGDAVPDEIAKRVEMLVIAGVEPKLDREAVLKLARAFPIEFYQLTNRITVLTGEGMVLGESSGSGAIPASEPLAPSAGDSADHSTN